MHSHTSSPRWLKLRWAQVTMPAFGRDLLSRTLDAFAFGTKRVADEDRLGKDELVVAEVRDERAERRVVDADADHQSEGEDGIDQRLAELGLRRRFMVDVQRLRIMGEGGNQQIVGLGHRARDRMLDAVADRPLIEIAPCHASRSTKRLRPCQARALLPCQARLEIAHVDVRDRRERIARSDDVAEMAEDLFGDTERLQRDGMPPDQNGIGRELVAHRVEHSADVFQLVAEPEGQPIVGRRSGRRPDRRLAPAAERPAFFIGRICQAPCQANAVALDQDRLHIERRFSAGE